MRKHKGQTKFLGQRVDHGVDDGVFVGGCQRLFRVGQRRWRLIDGSCHRFGIRGEFWRSQRSGPKVDRDAPCHAGQKRAFVVDVLPPAIAIELQESLLNCIFSVMGVKQDCIGDLKDKARLALHERRKLRIWASGQDSLPTPSYGSRTSETSASSHVVYTPRRREAAKCSNILLWRSKEWPTSVKKRAM